MLERAAPRVALLALVVMAATGCAVPSRVQATFPSGPPGPRVVATTTVLGDVVREIVGDAGIVRVLMPPGTDPHGFTPSAQQAELLRHADLVVANGLALEESLVGPLQAAEQDGVPVLRLGEHLDPVSFADEQEAAGGAGVAGDDHADEHAGGGGEPDPHVWMDPVRMAEGARLIAARLAAVDTAGVRTDAAWQAAGAAYADRILAAHRRIAALLATVPGDDRLLVTNHDSLGYLARRYGLRVIGTVIPGTSTQAAPSARGFARLVALIRATGAPAIFVDSTSSTRLADALAEEIGRDIRMVVLYSGSLGPPGSGADTYLGMLTTDAQRIARALGGASPPDDGDRPQ